MDMNNKQTTTERTDDVRQAYEAGRTWASNLQPGDTFLGCKPEADSRYTDSLSRNVFVIAALDVLKTVRLCTHAQTLKISSIKPKVF